jgi:DNA modification methylase
MTNIVQTSALMLPKPAGEARPRLAYLLTQDLGFHDVANGNGLHSLHAFPAKFPPQLPKLFIDKLTQPGDIVLDPMMGSGTTIVEAMLAGRHGVGFDIDPMAVRLTKAKTTPLDPDITCVAGYAAVDRAQWMLKHKLSQIEKDFVRRYDDQARKFIEYWFTPNTRLEVTALLREIERVPDQETRAFLALAFSAIIITKSGGVSLARDLAHTRPHRVMDKTPRPALTEFKKRVEKNSRSLAQSRESHGRASVQFGNAESLPLADETIDLIVTSPPYASNAIDYMRAHKFSLVWFGHPLSELSALRGRYIGGEAASRFHFVELPQHSSRVVQQVSDADRKKGLTLHRYYSEITRMLSETRRVLKPGKAAIVVVGSSTMRGIDTQTHICIGEIGQGLGLELVGIAPRQLDRDRRMMPARFGGQQLSQIEERMHEEHVIAFMRPLLP